MDIILYLISVVFFSSLINSTFGFGFALFCMPLLSLKLELSILGPLVPLLFLSGSAMIVYKGRKEIAFKSILPLMIAATIAVPIGVLLAKYGSDLVIKSCIGGFIILFSLYNLFAPTLPKLENDKWAPAFGALSGLFAGAYNISGPPAVIYGTLRQWAPSIFRVSLQCYFLYVTLLIISSHVYFGSYKNSVILQYFLFAFPAMLLAVPVGKKINNSIKDPIRFGRYVYMLMIVSGTMLILKSFGLI